MKALLIAPLLLTLGCAGSIEGYGVKVGMAWGNSSHHCAADQTGPDCLSGGELSDNAASVAAGVVEGKGE